MGVNHVYRGGSWFHSAYASRSASRDGRRQLYRFNNLGFRPALVVSPTLVETNPGPPISQTILPKSPAQIVSAPVSKPIDQPPPIRQTTVPSPSVTTVVPPKPPITSHESESVKRNYSSVPNPRPPFQTVKVINVKMNDSLALREGPSSQSRKLGNIPYNATGIELLNDSRTNGRDHWFAVVWQGIRGWVNGSYVIYD